MIDEKPHLIPRWKRALDLSCIFVSVPLWLPLMILLSIWIKMASKGPVFFRQERVGYRGRHFSCLKFRSMKVDAETQIHENYMQNLIATDVPMTKMDAKGDARLIPLGKLLRASGMDELPQILNVLRGEMSLVGPRPCTTIEFQHYLPEHKERVNAPPGLTGLWQVNGKNRTTFREMIDLDVLYGKTMSVSLDLRIMLKTVPALIVQALESRAAKVDGKSAVLLRVVGPKQSQRVPSGLHQLR